MGQPQPRKEKNHWFGGGGGRSDRVYRTDWPAYRPQAGSANPNVARFIDWILSPQGQSLVDLTGYTPLAGI